MRKIKRLSSGNVKLFKDQLEHYEKLDIKAHKQGISYQELMEREQAMKWLKVILWEDRHAILAAHEARLKDDP